MSNLHHLHVNFRCSYVQFSLSPWQIYAVCVSSFRPHLPTPKGALLTSKGALFVRKYFHCIVETSAGTDVRLGGWDELQAEIGQHDFVPEALDLAGASENMSEFAGR